MSTAESTILLRSDPSAPPLPRNIEETKLDRGFLMDLALKAVYADTNCTSERVADRLRLPTSLVEQLLQDLYREKLVEISGTIGFGNHRYAMLEYGWQRVQRLLDVNGYIGAAPVSLQTYTETFLRQCQSKKALKREAVRGAMSEYVLPETSIQTLGLVASSRRCLFMTGPAGNGKTSIAKALHNVQPGEICIPYAIEVDGQIIKVFDHHAHHPVARQTSTKYDHRWVQVERPMVIVGGEMTIETLDLIYNQSVKYYEAPFQLKSNGGTLLIDDFGRQRVNPRDLLNRWI